MLCVLLSTTPRHDASEVLYTTEVALLFTRPMQIDSVIVAFEPAAVLTSAKWSEDRISVSYLLAVPLAPMTTYNGVVSGVDDDGNEMGSVRSFSFTTRATPASPQVVSIVPANGVTAVATNAQLSVVFSKAMAAVNVGLSPNVDLGEPTWSADKKTVVYEHAASWAPATTYVVSLSGTDSESLPLAGERVFSFTTLDPTVAVAPTITTVNPAANAVNVPRNALIGVQFSKPMNETSVAVTLSSGTCSLSWDDSSTLCTCTPLGPLTANNTITMTISGALDTHGLALSGTTMFSFTTNNQLDNTPPTLMSSTPAVSVPPPTDVAPAGNIILDFSKAMDVSATQNAFSVNGAAPVGAITWLNGGTRMVFVPSTPYAFEQTVTWRLTTAATAGGIALASEASGVFKIYQNVENRVIFGEAALDGIIALTAPSTGVVDATNTEMLVGDGTGSIALRSFYSFKLNAPGAIPSNVISITGATFTTYYYNEENNPFPSLGSIYAESILFGDALTFESAWAATTHTRSPCVGCPQLPIQCEILSSATNTLGFKSCDATVKLKRDWNDAANANKHCQFRLRHEVDNDADNAFDINRFYASEVSVQSYRPTLSVSFTAPSVWP